MDRNTLPFADVCSNGTPFKLVLWRNIRQDYRHRAKWLGR